MANSGFSPQYPGVEVSLKGKVQGVGFRPLVYRLAVQQGLDGFVLNRDGDVAIYLRGDTQQAEGFCRVLTAASCKVASIEQVNIATMEFDTPPVGFAIHNSEQNENRGLPPADAASCTECLAELSDPASRYYQYPFLSCTHCGPRFSIIDSLPYDRTRTSMAPFTLCKACQHAYQNVNDRRFHAQTLACAQCGPELWLYNHHHGSVCGSPQQLFMQCSEWLNEGKILAVKSVGGFKLCCDGTREDAIDLLRQRKRRPDKPLAIMMKDLAQAEQYFSLTMQEKTLLTSPQAPVVLLDKSKAHLALPTEVAPRQATIGVMLANTPLNWLLLDSVKKPLVMTSGNPNGAPICMTNHQAIELLSVLADGFILHNCDIRHRVDDSVLRIINAQPRLIRRARGYVPEPIRLPRGLSDRAEILAMGADMKNCFCIGQQGKAVLSAHNGDLHHPAALDAWRHGIDEMLNLLCCQPTAIAIDCHPEYQSSRWGKTLAGKLGVPLICVQHHHAHMVACLTEHQVAPDQQVLGVVLDGLGMGTDGRIWGGEFLLGDYRQVERVGHLRYFPLLGNDKANQQPWRNLLAQLAQAGDWQQWVSDLPVAAKLCSPDAQALQRARERFVQSSSMGRLFDAVAALLTDCPDRLSFEGQAAMELECLAAQYPEPLLESYPLSLSQDSDGICLDPAAMWYPLLGDIQAGRDNSYIAAKFHQSLINSLSDVVVRLSQLYEGRFHAVALTGGVFQNGILLAGLTQRLTALGLTVYSAALVPANDGGIALGQTAIAMAQQEEH